MVFGILNNSRNSSASPTAQTQIYFINDGGTTNLGVRKVDGVDWSVSYDWDMANLGAFNTGMTGTYYLHDISINGPGAPPVDRYHTTISSGTIPQVGVSSLPRFRYRARLGWSNGPWQVTGFLNYQSHYVSGQAFPPNVDANTCAAGGLTAGGTSPCAIQNYTGLAPPWYSVDLSFGYDTGEDPMNDYLKHIGINLVVQDIMNKHAAFQYRPGPQQIAAFDVLKNNEGRVFSVLLTKTW
jgi:hypothetical protein